MYKIKAHDENGQVVVNETITGYFAAMTRVAELKAQAVNQGYFWIYGEDECENIIDSLCR